MLMLRSTHERIQQRERADAEALVEKLRAERRTVGRALAEKVAECNDLTAHLAEANAVLDRAYVQGERGRWTRVRAA